MPLSLIWKKAVLTSLLSLVFILSSLTVIAVRTKKRITIHIGEIAPDFTLPSEQGEQCKLSSMRGKKVVLVFYPMSNSHRCKKELCSLRNGFQQLEEAKIHIWAINTDSITDNKCFKEKHGLPFHLLSDPTKQVAALYGAKQGRFWFNKRLTILIDEDGYIVAILENIDVADHALQIIEAFEQSAR